jgi:hypothetical protein
MMEPPLFQFHGRDRARRASATIMQLSGRGLRTVPPRPGAEQHRLHVATTNMTPVGLRQTSFNHAFSRWTGRSPSEVRKDGNPI